MLLSSGAVKCWGQGYYGQLGYDDSADVGSAAGEMGDALPAVDLAGRTAVAISVGKHYCTRAHIPVDTALRTRL